MNILPKIGLAMLLLAIQGGVAVSAVDPSRTAVDRLGEALIAGNSDGLRLVFPQRGKVRVRLVLLGPEQGALHGSQLHAVLHDFLERGNVNSYEVRTVKRSERQALATADLALIDRDGARARVRLHLVLEPEGDRWVLREIRESGL